MKTNKKEKRKMKRKTIPHLVTMETQRLMLKKVSKNLKNEDNQRISFYQDLQS